RRPERCSSLLPPSTPPTSKLSSLAMADQGDGGAPAPAAPAPAVVLGAQPEEPAGDAGVEEPLEVLDAPVLDAPVPVVGEGGEDPQEEEALDGGDNQAPALDEGVVDLLTELVELDEPEPEDVDESAVRNLMDELAQGEPKKRKIDYTLVTQGPTTAGGSGAGVATLPKAGPSMSIYTMPSMVPPAGAAPPVIIPGLPFVGVPPVGAGGRPRLPVLATGPGTGALQPCPSCHTAIRQPNQARLGMPPPNRPNPHFCLCLRCQEWLERRIHYCEICRDFYAMNPGLRR
uniref:Uncharacterized protein n=3 Tax=Triticinae TaxID=1648030 RepID=A0A453AXR3_AEGTS